MKETFTKLLLVFFLASCNSTNEPKVINYANFTEREMAISVYSLDKHKNDTLAIIKIKIPDRLDTSYEWQRYPDAVRSNVRRFRFVDSRYPLASEKEELYYYLKPADSLYQFTISYLTFRPKDSDSILPQLKIKDTVSLLEKIDQHEINSEKIQWGFKKFELINNQPFIIAAYQIPSICRENQMKLSLFGITRIKTRELTIRTECDAKDTTGFINNMYKSFLSIKIKEK